MPVPLQTVQLPDALHLEQSALPITIETFPVPSHFVHLPVPLQPLHSAIFNSPNDFPILILILIEIVKNIFSILFN